MKIKSLLGAGLVTCATLLSVNAQAYDSGWYLGGSIGQSRQNNAYGVAGGALSSSSATGYQLTGGYKLNKYFGGEISYLDFGSATFTAPAAIVGNANLKGWNFSAVGSIPMTDSLGLFGKLGIFNANPSGIISGSSNKPSWGLGLKYDLGSNWDVKGEYEQFRMGSVNNVAGSSNGKAQMYSVGVDYNF